MRRKNDSAPIPILKPQVGDLWVSNTFANGHHIIVRVIDIRTKKHLNFMTGESEYKIDVYSPDSHHWIDLGYWTGEDNLLSRIPDTDVQ